MNTLCFPAIASLLIASGGGIAQPASAYDRCVEPEEPTCISSRYAFENELAATRCRRDVERFSREIESYIVGIEHLKLQYEQKDSQARMRLNCRIRGEPRC